MLRFLRTPNLIIVLLTQYLLFYGLLLPNLQRYDIPTSLDHFHFFLLSFTTVLIAGGGYVINDLLDYPIDQINKPERLYIGQNISMDGAWRFYWVLVIIGMLIALYLAYYVRTLGLFFIYPIAVGVLYAYSRFFKKQFLIGNSTIAIFCAFVAGLVWFAERQSFAMLGKVNADLARQIALIFLAYMSFGFISTFYREVIKDIEDREGDQLHGCQTVPIVWGVQPAKWFATFLGLSLFSLLAIAWYYIYPDYFWTRLFAIFAVIAPILYSLWQLKQAQEKGDFTNLSRWAKYIMLSGLLLLLVYLSESKIDTSF